ncbi:MAG: ABC transporter permease, partial [Bryobacterales bacterium]|nr:ABC transporter permease [Bryobacterales bacterium]
MFRRLAYYFRRRHFERDLDEEMRHHMSLSGAAQFGNITRWKEESRAMWGWMFFEQLGQDLRYALRAIKNNRAFTALAVLSLALGIGANTAIFSFMDAILLRSLPVKDPRELVVLNWRGQGFGHPASGVGQVHMSVVRGAAGRIDADPRGGIISGAFPYPAFELLGMNNSVFSSLFAYCRDFSPYNVMVRGQADMGRIEYVSGSYFRGLGVPPAAGRLLTDEDDRASTGAVISFGYAQKRFGDPFNAVGSAISINNAPFTILGVAPPEFYGVDSAGSPDLYVPMRASLVIQPPGHPYRTPQQYLDRNFYGFEMMARLRPGVSLAQAQAALAPAFHEWVLSTAANDYERAHLPELALMPGATGVDSLRLSYSKPLFLLLILVALILAIACANVANLLLARATVRRREMAVRLSMGAGRWRVVRQLLTESVLLASLGGTFGIAVAVWGIRFLTLLLANGQEGFTLRAGLNWHVLGVAAGLSVLTGILFGLAPAIQSTRVNAVPALKSDLRQSAGQAAPLRFLVAAQLAIAMLVLVAAGLFIRTLSNLNSIQLGFNRENLLLFEVNARLAGHRGTELADFYRNLQRQFQGIPGVRDASLSNMSLMRGGRTSFSLRVRGKETPSIGLMAAGPRFLATMQIPVLAGRDIEDRGQPVAVVDERFAKTYFPGENPIGQHLNIPDQDMEISGISGDARYGDVTRDAGPVIYYLYSRAEWPPLGQMVFELRTAGNPLTYANAVREIVRKADPGVPVSNIKTEAAEIDERTNQER